MIDRPVQQAPEAQDEDAVLAPVTAAWLARALGEDWLEEEAGIYRHVGARADDLPPTEPPPAVDVGQLRPLGDA